MRARHVVEPDDFEHGLRCMLCDRLIEVGDVYAEIFDSIAPPMEVDGEFTPVMVLTCDECADRDDLHERLAERDRG